MELQKNNSELVQLLTDLIKINFGRIEAYNSTIEHMKDNVNLKFIFGNRIQQSRNFISELDEELLLIAGKNVKNRNSNGNIYEDWLNLKNSLNKMSTSSVLDKCSVAERATVRVYEIVLETELPGGLRQKITEQKNEIKNSCDFISNFIDFNLDLTV